MATSGSGFRPMRRDRRSVPVTGGQEKTGDAAKDFTEAKSTLRDTVKWLAASFAALAAVVVGSAPLSGLGTLSIPSPKFGYAVAALLIGFFCICRGLYITLHILRPVLIYRSDLLIEPDAPELTEEARELGRVRAMINTQARDLLPRNYKDLAGLSKASKKVDTILEGLSKKTSMTSQEKRDLAIGLGRRKMIDDEVIGLLPLALYLTLHERLARSTRPLLILGVVALVSLAIYGITVQGDGPKQAASPTLVINDIRLSAKARDAVLPALPAVLFDTGKAVVSASGIRAVQRARDAMRDQPDTLLLVLAHTDTVGGRKVNAWLARRRAETVVALLKGTGGISAGRIYVAELPKLDTPEVTLPEQSSIANRSVELKLVALPKAE